MPLTNLVDNWETQVTPASVLTIIGDTGAHKCTLLIFLFLKDPTGFALFLVDEEPWSEESLYS